MTPRDMCGIYFCLRHRYLWPLLRAQVHPMSHPVHNRPAHPLYIPHISPKLPFSLSSRGNLAWFNAVFLVLAFFVDETLVKIFDAVFNSSRLHGARLPRRVIIPDGTDPVKQLGKPTKSAIYSPFSFRLTLEFILLLPLTFIPLFGGPLYCLHYRYFKLLGLTRTQQQAFVREKASGSTRGLGMVALLLQLVPVFSMLFLLTTAAGAALLGGGFE
ncbi:hypothetical protein B0H14DRAFT_3556214 [Mycena olivaceomarginata]|nr:hypothetical protein B0H14DRAFT_3556214 [Mycena olivaceomarginata]